MNIYWINMTNDIKFYISHCITFNKVKKFEVKSKTTSKTILSHSLRNRYVFDLWDLSAELISKNSNYKYVLDIIEHYSKFTNSFLLNTKESQEIFPIIKNFFKINGFPKYLITDNGKEFKNKILSYFCEQNKVRFFRGLISTIFTRCGRASLSNNTI